VTEHMNKQAAQLPAFRPVRPSARLAVGGLLLAGAAWGVRAVWEFRLFLAGEPASGPPDQGEGVHRPLNALENSYHAVSSLAGGAVVVCGLLFVSWLWLLRDNARALSGRPPRYLGIWVILGWFFPVVSFWFPRGIVVDAFRAGEPGRKVPLSVEVWWGLWLIGMVSGVGIVARDTTDELIARAYTEVWPLLASDAAVIGAAVAGVFAVLAVSRSQEDRIRAAGAVPSAEAVGTPAPA
jgi:hypothetical protein